MKIESANHLRELTDLLVFRPVILFFNAHGPKELDNLQVGIRIWLSMSKFPLAKRFPADAELVRQCLLANAPENSLAAEMLSQRLR